ncbi:hypothetical protein BIW11_03233 [Tropilaelaps mercedesae]|uniref:Uncharacterized protein n=1 Tax=Tropilaelaps mercedesae TaxID=418985 RepID=A0A1V9XQ32_9ACAR|nr:hypothetical protein BIW11_03233 [Tropilaelaps mercedesae]
MFFSFSFSTVLPSRTANSRSKLGVVTADQLSSMRHAAIMSVVFALLNSETFFALSIVCRLETIVELIHSLSGRTGNTLRCHWPDAQATRLCNIVVLLLSGHRCARR